MIDNTWVQIVPVGDLEGVLEPTSLVPCPVRQGMQKQVSLRLKQALQCCYTL